MSFENIVGNTDVKQLLSHSILNSNILHSYMFIGNSGIGKCLLAREFAEEILNVNVELENNPDFMQIDPNDGKSIKIEQIRFLQEKIAEKPISSNKKVYIINDSDMMTKEAQNCLLKTLEEPPKYAVIILILANENNMLATIKSRCTKIMFKPLSDEDILFYFSKNNLPVPNKRTLNLCGGSIGKLIKMQDESINYEQIDDLFDNIENIDMIDVWKKGDIFYQSKDNIVHLLEYVNIILFEYLKKTNNLHYASCISYVEQAKNRLSSNANFDMCIDNFLLKIWEEFHE